MKREELKKEETAICNIHGKFYAGYCECPICKALKKEDNN